MKNYLYLLGKKLKNLSFAPNSVASSKVSGNLAPNVSGNKATAKAPVAQTRVQFFL